MRAAAVDGRPLAWDPASLHLASLTGDGVILSASSARADLSAWIDHPGGPLAFQMLVRGSSLPDGASGGTGARVRLAVFTPSGDAVRISGFGFEADVWTWIRPSFTHSPGRYRLAIRGQTGWQSPVLHVQVAMRA